MNQKSSYKKVASHEAEKGTFDKVLLLYSGGLDTSIMLKWIQDYYQVEVIALTVNIGQPSDDFEGVKQKALDLGAKKAYVLDVAEEFVEEYALKAVKANADYQGGYHLFCPLGRAIIAKKAVEVAQTENIKVIAHGCTGKGNDQLRFEGYITTLDPSLKTIAPVREWQMGREEELDYAHKNNISVKQTEQKIYSYDDNIMGVSIEGGEIEEIDKIPQLENIVTICNTPEKAPDKAEILNIEFEKGVPVALNGKKMSLIDLVKQLNIIGAEHAIGITHLIEDRVVGLKVRGIYEEPAAEIMIQAHKKLEYLVCTRDENEFKTIIDQKWAYLCYEAKWFTPFMKHLESYIESVNKKVTGKVQIRLYKGNVTVVALESDYSIFDEHLATFMKDDLFNQNASAGFIELWNLPQKSAYNLTKNIYE